MDKFCISTEYTIKEAIDKIEAGKNRVVIVMNEAGKVIGVISQGDIIRALAFGKDIYSKINSLVRPNFYYLNERDLAQAYQLFKKYKITLLPIVNDKFQLVSIVTLDDIYEFLEGKEK